MPIPKPPATAGHFGQGIAYPLDYDAGGRLRLSFGLASVEDAMEAIVQTAAGERVMQPDNGGAIGLFEPVRDTYLMTEAIKQTVREHEPRVEADSIELEVDNVDSTGKVEMRVTYKPTGEASARTLTYPYWAGPSA